MCKPQKDADNFVAVSMRPNDRLPTLLLSIVKSGMAYLPLDVEYPANRVKHILNESEPLLVVIEKDGKGFIMIIIIYRKNDCVVIQCLL